MFLPESVHGNETIQETFHIVFTQFSYSLIVFTIYGIPSLLVIVKVVLTIMNPTYKSYFGTPFFVLFTHECIISFITFIFDYFTVRLPLSGFITGWLTMLPEGPYLTVIYALSYQLKYMAFYTAVFISISRTIIIYAPADGNVTIKKLLPIFFLIIYFLPILTTWFLYPATCYMKAMSPPGFAASMDYVKVYPKVYFLYVSDAYLSFTLHPYQIDLLMFTPVWLLFFTHPKFKSTQQATLVIISDNNIR
ncbi:hypothetical protein NECAME_08771 [Necator americanus]|uniref:Serpentine receptor class gamma n=1 Tax=Necator americanus TaxID=51031 RepID=W2TGQ1_NECAM|nr:hypothetical protein NECAME_08771 [Necator americanus]ETN81018.1 hypothetical protein NECAME_08771 [Necator americanus]